MPEPGLDRPIAWGGCRRCRGRGRSKAAALDWGSPSAGSARGAAPVSRGHQRQLGAINLTLINLRL
jgi:hypothetical protein